MQRRWSRSRFDETPEDPQASLVNLVDIMLVFICGLIVALVSAKPQFSSSSPPIGRTRVSESSNKAVSSRNFRQGCGANQPAQACSPSARFTGIRKVAS